MSFLCMLENGQRNYNNREQYECEKATVNGSFFLCKLFLQILLEHKRLEHRFYARNILFL